MDIDQPLFVIGNPRSGTSLLRLILSSHSEIIIPPECGFIIWLYPNFKDWVLMDSSTPSARGKYLDSLFASKKFDTWGLKRMLLNNLIIERQPYDYATLCALTYLAYASKHSSKPTIWGDKNNFHTDFLPTLSEIYPNARFLHLVRDGRDVACSYREVMKQKSLSPYAPKLKTDIKSIAIEWSNNVLKVEDYLDSLSSSKRLTIRYEDLVKDTESILSMICTWLKLTYEPQMLEFHDVNKRMQLEPADTMDWKKRTMEPISAGTVERHREMLSVQEGELFNQVSGRALTKFDYKTC
jgi:hypothetical protein